MVAAAESPAQSQAIDEVILRAEKVTKIFGGTVALDNVDFNVYRGKVNVLIGENGAGKSTLMKVLAGVEQPTGGKLMLEGKEVSFKSSRDATAHGIGMIFQELYFFHDPSTTENIFIGQEIVSQARIIDQGAQ